jgi:tRNA threonylcarbamoyladenosine modification (KEOPS) complex Cgi121 subunit
MEVNQLEEVLGIVREVSRKNESIGFDYCVSEDDEVVRYVGSTLNPLCVTQVIPLRLVISIPQVRIPALLTIEAFTKGENISNKPEIEYLLYFAGSRQIKQTLEKLRKYLTKPYLVIRFCEETAEESFKKIPKGVKCSSKEAENALKPDVEDIKEFYELEKTTEEKLLKDILTLINNLKLRPKT